MDELRNDAPPLRATRFLKWFCKPEYYEDIQGDLEEEYRLLIDNTSSLYKAKYWYRWQIVRLFRPSMIKKVKPQQEFETQNTMFKNYLKIGARNLWKYKSGSIINTTGLAIGLAAFILIALFVQDELSYDRHHENADEIYRVTVQNFTPDGDMSRHWAFASAGHASRLKEDYSAITHATRFHLWAFPDIILGEQTLPGQQVVFADDDVFEIFTFPFLLGSKEEAFKDIFSLVLTEETAVRLYGDDWMEQDILGNTVKLARDGQEAPYKISGVIKDMPKQQHFRFEYLAPIKFIEQLVGEGEVNNVGGNYNWLTYVRIAPGTDIRALEAESDGLFDKYMQQMRAGRKPSEFYAFIYQPLLDIHLNSNLEGEVEVNGSMEQVYIFSIIGLLVLLVACVNYMNLATSHYSRRMKEVGVRKVIGAGKSSLVAQFLTESTLITFIAIPLAVILIYLGLPYINVFMDKSLTFNIVENFELIGGVFGLAIGVGLIAGFYPALFLSKIETLRALKGESSMRASRWNFRYWLVTFQYAVTIALIFAILVIEGQMKFIKESDPGFERAQILDLNLSRSLTNLDRFKMELLQDPGIEKAAYSSRIPTGRLADSWGARFFQGDSLVRADFRLPIISVDEDFIDTYAIDLIAGTNFTKEQDAFEDSVGYYLINRKAAEAMGFSNPADVVGEKIAYGPFNDQTFKAGRIQGVVEDFHFESMHSQIVPMIMIKTTGRSREISLKIKPEGMSETLDRIEAKWAEFDSKNPANYRFVDERFDEQYQQEQRLSTMIKVFTVLAIFIGCLGLVGMVGFIIETKTKEIGIRKVLGASVQNILVMISNQFFVLIAIAFVLAIPISYWLMSGWLENFVYRMNISILIIVMPIIFAAIFTMLTLGVQTIKASLSNPVECLKDE